VRDLFAPARFRERLVEVLDLHNFVLQHYLKADPVDANQVADQALALGEKIAPMVADTPRLLAQAMARGDNLLFEGAQGALLDVDHGTYPYVTSSNCVAGAAAAGAGVPPSALHYVLGITKAYTTRVGSGPFPTELFDDAGRHLATRGKEFGAVTGRPRRTGWFDGPALKRSIQLNGVTGLCVTKLDVLDGLASVKLCVGYREKGVSGGPLIDMLPFGADAVDTMEAVFEEMPGWSESTFGVRHWDALPASARRFLERLSEVSGAPIHLVSTGPDRDETILLHHPFH
jgi:adenylosuccinate synthase